MELVKAYLEKINVANIIFDTPQGYKKCVMEYGDYTIHGYILMKSMEREYPNRLRDMSGNTMTYGRPSTKLDANICFDNKDDFIRFHKAYVKGKRMVVESDYVFSGIVIRYDFLQESLANTRNKVILSLDILAEMMGVSVKGGDTFGTSERVSSIYT